MTINRRSFLTGFAAAAIAAKLPLQPAAVPVDIEFTVTIAPLEQLPSWAVATPQEILADVRRMVAAAFQGSETYLYCSAEAYSAVAEAYSAVAVEAVQAMRLPAFVRTVDIS